MASTIFVLDGAMRAEVISALLARLCASYVFPEAATEMGYAIRRRQEAGEYDKITGGAALCDLLTAHLREVSADLHLRLVFHEEPQPPRATVSAWDDPAYLAAYWRRAAGENYGFRRAERLAGNVGLLVFTAIDEAEYTAETIAAALAFVANTDALLLDLRENGGGAPSGVAFLCSYFFDREPVHLNSIYSRVTGSTQQFWTLPFVPGRRYLDKPLFVLTSRRTFSGAEELAYNLQSQRRATIVGERTAGAANPLDVYQLTPHVDVRVPTGRAINPITGGNWEGTGVLPDIDCAADDAQREAHAVALRHVLAHAGGGDLPTTAEARATIAELERAGR